MAIGLMLHHFYGDGNPYIQGALTSEEFEGILTGMSRLRILSPEEWVYRTRAGTLEATDTCLTFDDALLSQIEIALPVLDRHGLKAFFFVYSSIFNGTVEMFEVYRFYRNIFFGSVTTFFESFYEQGRRCGFSDKIDSALESQLSAHYLREYTFYSIQDRRFRYVRDQALRRQEFENILAEMMRRDGVDPVTLGARIWMNDDHLSDLTRSGHMVGLHSYSHPTNIGQLDATIQRNEYNRNRDHLLRVLGCQPKAMAHPSNSYNADTLAIMREMGVEVGFRSNASLKDYSPLEQPRLDHLEFHLHLARSSQ